MAIADRQTYTRIAATVEAKMSSWVAAMLTDTISMPTDGPFITADNDAVNKSPVNPGFKDLANMLTGLAGSIYGNIVGVTIRSLKSLCIDGTGGAASTATANTLKVVSGTDKCEVGPGGVDITDGGGSPGLSNLRDYYLAFLNTATSGSNPAKTAAGANRLDALMIPKAWAWWSTDGVGGISLDDGARIASVSIVGTNVRLTFASAFDNATYATIVHCENVTGGVSFEPLIIENLAWVELDPNALDPTNTVMKGRVIIFGRQTT